MTVAILPSETVQYNELTGVSTVVRDVMATADEQVAHGDVDHFRAFPTGFSPLDDVSMVGCDPATRRSGGPSGVGKTIFSLQLARNIALMRRNSNVMYVCYEHDRWHPPHAPALHAESACSATATPPSPYVACIRSSPKRPPITVSWTNCEHNLRRRCGCIARTICQPADAGKSQRNHDDPGPDSFVGFAPAGV